MTWVATLQDDFVRDEMRRRPAPPVRDAELEEFERQAKRGEIKEKVAAARFNEKRYCECQTAIVDCNNLKEAEADKHVRKCHPWQNELRQIEAEQVQRIKLREELDPDLEARRRELITNIQDANEELEQFVKRQDRLVAQLELDLREFGRNSCPGIFEGDLLGLASPELRMRIRTRQRTVTFANTRLRAAQDVVDSLRVRDIHGRMTYAMAERDEAQDMLNRAMQELEEVTQAAIDE